MRAMPSRCPLCESELEVVRMHCPSCDTSFEGRFSPGRLADLSDEQWDFVTTFVRCEGKINRVEQELGLSYPTIRNKLREVIRAMGYEPAREETMDAAAERRRSILSDLEDGRLTAEEAMRALREGGNIRPAGREPGNP